MQVGTSTTTSYPFEIYTYATSSLGGAIITKHVYAGSEVIADIQGSTSTAATYYIHSDHLGGADVVSSGTAKLENLFAYQPFGSQRINRTSSNLNETRRYIGQEYDTASGLNYLNARYYEANRGQFLSQDPVFWEVGKTPDGRAALSNPQSMNSYSYAVNNPVLLKDSDGRWVAQAVAVLLLGAIVVGYGAFDYGAYSGNLEVAQIGLSLAQIGEVGGAGVIQAGGGRNPITGEVNTNSVAKTLAAEQAKSTSNGPYAILTDPATVGQGKDFTQSQKANILLLNMLKNGGLLKDDQTGQVLSYPEKSVKGVSTPRDTAQIDHIDAKSPRDHTKQPGTNSYGNAKVLSAPNNRLKSNK